MPVQMIINQAGPLPLKANFDAKGNQVMYLEVNGSVYSGNANKMVGIEIQVDNKSVGKAQIFSNGASTHRAVVPAYLPIQLSQGTHTLSLSASTTDTTSDYNDIFTAVIHY